MSMPEEEGRGQGGAIVFVKNPGGQRRGGKFIDDLKVGKTFVTIQQQKKRKEKKERKKIQKT